MMTVKESMRTIILIVAALSTICQDVTAQNAACSVCGDDAKIENPFAQIPAATLSFLTVTSSCFSIEINAQNGDYTADQCAEFATASVPDLCTCVVPDDAAAPSVFSPVAVTSPVAVSSPVATPVAATAPVAAPVTSSLSSSPVAQVSVSASSEAPVSGTVSAPAAAPVEVSAASPAVDMVNATGQVVIQLTSVLGNMTNDDIESYNSVLSAFFQEFIFDGAAVDVVAVLAEQTLVVEEKKRFRRSLQSSSTPVVFPLNTTVNVSASVPASSVDEEDPDMTEMLVSTANTHSIHLVDELTDTNTTEYFIYVSDADASEVVPPKSSGNSGDDEKDEGLNIGIVIAILFGILAVLVVAIYFASQHHMAQEEEKARSSVSKSTVGRIKLDDQPSKDDA